LLSNRLIHTAGAFFVIGVALGIYMGASEDFRFMHVHAHLNLLGWVALAMTGLLYTLHPHLQRGWMAHGHYWLHTLGLLVFMGSFAWRVARGSKPVALIAIGASMASLGVLSFVLNVFTRLGAARPALQ
jgi:cbb3-type cytochrome oxidase subunit 1